MVLFATAPFQAIDTVPMATGSSQPHNRACSHDRELVLLRDTCAFSQRKGTGVREWMKGVIQQKGGEMGREWEEPESGTRLKRRAMKMQA